MAIAVADDESSLSAFFKLSPENENYNPEFCISTLLHAVAVAVDFEESENMCSAKEVCIFQYIPCIWYIYIYILYINNTRLLIH